MLPPLKISKESVEDYKRWANDFFKLSKEHESYGNEAKAVEFMTISWVLFKEIDEFYDSQVEPCRLPNCS
jgi:hypothetical protein